MGTEIKRNDHSFAWFNATQFLGVLNDNIFKLLVVYFLIGTGDAQEAIRVQPIAQGLSTLPPLLFLSYAGRLADRYSKRNLIIGCKVLELGVMLLAVLAFWTGARVVLGGVLFLMYAQTAFFAPNKYGIICELVAPDQVIRANGRVQACSYIAILLGMIVTPWVSKNVAEHYIAPAIGCVLIAAAGVAFSVAVKTTRPAGRTPQASIIFIRDIVRTFRSISHKKGLLWAILGSAYFSFVGISLYFCIIPYGMSQLGMTKENSTYLFIFAIVGIALGSLLVGKIHAKPDRSRIIPAGILGLGIFSLLLGMIKPDYWFAGGLLFLMGVGAGMFVVPINAYIQLTSPHDRRGEIVAASEFLSRLSTLAAIGIFMVLSRTIQLSAAQLLVAFGLVAVLAGVSIFIVFVKK